MRRRLSKLELFRVKSYSWSQIQINWDGPRSFRIKFIGLMLNLSMLRI